VYVSHFLEEVREICDRFTVLRDGRSIRTGELSAVTNDELIAAMVGRSIESVCPTRQEASSHREQRIANRGPRVLTVRDLASIPRLRAASFELRRGEILGIAGLIG